MKTTPDEILSGGGNRTHGQFSETKSKTQYIQILHLGMLTVNRTRKECCVEVRENRTATNIHRKCVQRIRLA